MKKFFPIAILLILTAAACSEKSGNDLTKSIVGKYTNPTTKTEIVVNKVDETTVSMSVIHEKGESCEYDLGFSNVKMNSANSFTLNEVTFNNFYCNKTVSGNGTFSNNNLSIFALIVSDKTALTCCFNKNENLTISASK